MSLVIEILLIAVLAYGYAVLFALVRGHRFLFRPPQTGYRDAGGLIRIPLPRGETLAAVYRSCPDSRITVLLMHGNSEDLSDILSMVDDLGGRGYSVLAFDYRGYGLSPGIPTERTVFQDVLAVHDYAVSSLGLPAGSLMVWGRSLGSGPAIHLASCREVGWLVIEGGFRSAFRVPTRFRLLPFERFDNARRISTVGCPILILHGTGDRVVPAWHARALHERASEPRRLVWVEGSHHVDLHRVDPEAVFDALSELKNGSTRPGID